MAAAGTLYQLAAPATAAGGELKLRQHSAPVNKGYSLAGRSEIKPKITQIDADTISVCGRQEVARLRVNTTNYTIESQYGDSKTITVGMGGFSIMAKPGNAGFNYTDYSWGYPYMLMPSRLNVMSQTFDFYRFEHVTYTYVPTVSTATAGSVSFAWAPTVAGVTDIASVWDLWGSAPNTAMVLSQCPYFTQAPCWQAQSLMIEPRKHGICENSKDFVSIKINNSTGASDTAEGGVQADNFGFLHITMEDFATPVSNYTAGYIIADYKVTFHVPTPTKSLSALYNGTIDLRYFLDLPENRDLRERILDRYQDEFKHLRSEAGGVDCDAALKYVQERRSRKKEEDAVIVTKPRPTPPPRSGTPVPR